MKQLLLLLFIFLIPVIADAQMLALNTELFLVEPQQDAQEKITHMHTGKLTRGNLEINSREGSDRYRGIPWSIRIFLLESGETRVVHWIEDDDLRLTRSDELLMDEWWNATSFKARTFETPALSDGSFLRLNITPSPIPEEPQATNLDQQSFGLNFLCLKNSAVVIDDTFYIGSFTGFGEYLIVGVPGLAKVSMSFNPIRGWQPIGTYQDGVIDIELEGQHWMNVLAVKFGPGGIDRGGPFTVYGAIDHPVTSVERARELVHSRLENAGMSETRKNAVMEANAVNPYGGIGRGTIGSSEGWSEQLEQVASSFGKSLSECSH